MAEDTKGADPKVQAAQPKKADRAPRIGDDVLYVLGEASANRGQDRAAKISFVHDLSNQSPADQAKSPGLVNLHLFVGRENDLPAQKEHPDRALWPLKGITYDPSKKMGTWHFKD